MPRRRYELQQPELNDAVNALVERAQEVYGEHQGADYVRQILVTGVRLLKDGAETGDLRLLNSALKELRHSLRVFRPYEHRRKVAVFGSARTEPIHPDYEQARQFSERIVEAGWMVITGAGGGIMAAAQGGAGRGDSFGVNIRLPFEQAANETIKGDHKLITFRYFFTRKVTFVKEAHAIALFPGGFGTHDEALEALTLIQTGKGEMLPVVFIDSPGGSYWKEWAEYVEEHMAAPGFVSPEDMDLFMVTDDLDEAVSEILGFYSNYHSSRMVGDQLVIRVNKAPDEAELEALNTAFSDVIKRGAIRLSGPLDAEADEAPHCARVVLNFEQSRRGRLRQLIDRLNGLVSADASEPGEASPHELFALALSEDALAERDAED